jgi:hypothetical protein
MLRKAQSRNKAAFLENLEKSSALIYPWPTTANTHTQITSSGWGRGNDLHS